MSRLPRKLTPLASQQHAALSAAIGARTRAPDNADHVTRELAPFSGYLTLSAENGDSAAPGTCGFRQCCPMRPGHIRKMSSPSRSRHKIRTSSSERADARVGAGNPVTSCDLRILMDQAAEPVSAKPGRSPAKSGDAGALQADSVGAAGAGGESCRVIGRAR